MNETMIMAWKYRDDIIWRLANHVIPITYGDVSSIVLDDNVPQELDVDEFTFIYKLANSWRYMIKSCGEAINADLIRSYYSIGKSTLCGEGRAQRIYSESVETFSAINAAINLMRFMESDIVGTVLTINHIIIHANIGTLVLPKDVNDLHGLTEGQLKRRFIMTAPTGLTQEMTEKL
jgi:hypothetical protein